jgi:hypothetical protein
MADACQGRSAQLADSPPPAVNTTTEVLHLSNAGSDNRMMLR